MSEALPALLVRLQAHLGADPAACPVLGQVFEFYNRPNVHLAINELMKGDESATLIGVLSIDDYRTVSLTRLARPTSAMNYDEGPVEYADVALPNEQRLSCVKRGLFLFRYQNQPVALSLADSRYGMENGIQFEVMATTKEVAERVSSHVTKLVRHGTAFRGSVLSLERDCYGQSSLVFHTLPAVPREQVILPQTILERIERHTVSFSTHAERLLKVGRHLKRGILLYGPPGTGKTYTAMYLASRMPNRTVFLLTGAGMGSIEMACNMARVLAPATIILEDVDLIGTNREDQTVGANALLFELLNQMDGLANDADILFILTTNRPEALEAALAARPGRIDQAIEVPPPDADCRRRLFALYAQGLQLDVQRLDEFIQRTEGVSAAFIRELLRKAAIYAAIEHEGAIIVRDHHLDEAIGELLVAGGPLTQSLLGASRTKKADAACEC